MFEGSEHHDHGYFRAAAAGRRAAQRLDQHRSHQLLGSRADRRAGAGAVDGVGSHGLPAARAHRGQVQQPARRRAERAPPELREPALRAGRHGAVGGAVSARSSVSLAHDRRRRRPARHDARRGARRSSGPTIIPANASLSLAGDIETDAGLRRWPSGSSAICRAGPVPAPVRGRRAARGEPQRCCSKIASSCRGSISAGIRRRCSAPTMRSWTWTADVLAHGKTSRLYRSLVYERRVATDVSAYQHSREMSGVFQVACTAAAGVTLRGTRNRDPRTRSPSSRATGPTDDERRARARANRGAFRLSAADDRRLWRQVRSAERLQRVPRRPRVLRRRSRALPRRDRRAAWPRRRARWLVGGPVVTLSVVPRGRRELALPGAVEVQRLVSRVDRIAACRFPAPDRPFRFPRIARRRLANGLEVRAVTHRSVPVVSMVLLVPGGSAVGSRRAAPAWRRSPPACWMKAAAGSRRSRWRIAWRASAAISISKSAPTPSCVGLTTLDRFLETGLSLVHEIVTEPNLADADFDRIRNLRLERVRQMKDHAGGWPIARSRTRSTTRTPTATPASAPRRR